MPLRVIGKADTTRLCNPFKPRSDVDAIAEDIVFVDDDIPDVYPDPKLDPGIVRHGDVLCGDAALDFDRATSCVHRTGKLYQHAVAGGLDDPSAMSGDCGIDKGLSDRLQPSQGAFLVSAHKTAIARHVRRQYSRQPSLHPFPGQKRPLHY